MKYKSYKELFDAYKSGELTRETPLVMDNDDCYVYVDGVQVFSGDGGMDAEYILDAIGIPNEPC